MQPTWSKLLPVLLPLLAGLFKTVEKKGYDKESIDAAERFVCECVCVLGDDRSDSGLFLFGVLVGCVVTGFACKRWDASPELEEAIEELPVDVLPVVRAVRISTPSGRHGSLA